LLGRQEVTGSNPVSSTHKQAVQGPSSPYCFFISNTHGDVVALGDQAGNIVNRYAYGPWGEATRISEQLPQPFRYAGYYYDQDAELYWLRARWYDPGTGRFLSRDPYRGAAWNPLSLNRYLYGHANPSSTADPAGLSPRRGSTTIFEMISARGAMRRCPDMSAPFSKLGLPPGFDATRLNPAVRDLFDQVYTSVCQLYIDYFVDVPWFFRNVSPGVRNSDYWIPALKSMLRQIYVEIALDPVACVSLELPIGFREAWDRGVIQQSPSFFPIVYATSLDVGTDYGTMLQIISAPDFFPGRL
jgi:RHS repeat-associated protein